MTSRNIAMIATSALVLFLATLGGRRGTALNAKRQRGAVPVHLALERIIRLHLRQDVLRNTEVYILDHFGHDSTGRAIPNDVLENLISKLEASPDTMSLCLARQNDKVTNVLNNQTPWLMNCEHRGLVAEEIDTAGSGEEPLATQAGRLDNVRNSIAWACGER